MKFIRPDQRPLMELLVKRGALFFSLMCALAGFLYGVGTRQVFMDSTQIFLLRLSSLCAVILIPLCLFGAILNIPQILRHTKKLRYPGGFLAYILLGAVSTAVAAAASFILILLGGTS